MFSVSPGKSLSVHQLLVSALAPPPLFALDETSITSPRSLKFCWQGIRQAFSL